MLVSSSFYMILIRRILDTPLGVEEGNNHQCIFHCHQMILKEIHTVHYPGPPGNNEINKEHSVDPSRCLVR